MADEDGNAEDFDQNDSNNRNDESGKTSRFDPKTAAYMEDLLKEKHSLNTAAYPCATRFLQEEVSKVQQTGRRTSDTRYVDVYNEKTVKVVVKVLVPVREHPKFNFVGKLLGPKGNTLKRLQEETLCKMVILGRGSMKDKNKEEELRQSMDPKFAHLSDELHVEISSISPPAEAYARIAYALAEVKKYLQPEPNDDISFEQLKEMESYHTDPEDRRMEHSSRSSRPSYRPVGSSSGSRPSRGGKRPPLLMTPSRSSIMEKVDKRSSMGGPPVEYYEYEDMGRSSMSDHRYGDSSDGGGYYDDHHSHSIPPESSRGRYKGGYKAGSSTHSSASSRFVPRSAPYNRPHK